MAPPRDRPGEGIGGGGMGGAALCAVLKDPPTALPRGVPPTAGVERRPPDGSGRVPGSGGAQGCVWRGGGERSVLRPRNVRADAAPTQDGNSACGARGAQRIQSAGGAAVRGVCSARATRVQPLRVRTVPQPDRQPPLSHGPPPQKGGGCGGGGGAEQNEAGPPPPPSPPPGPPPAGADVPVPFSPPGSSAAAAGPNGTKRAGPGRAMTPPCGGALRCAVLCAVLCAQGSAATRAGTERPHGVGEGLG